MSENPDATTDPADEERGVDHSRDTEVSESDPNADSAEGLAGGMGVSSERVGATRGGEDGGATYGARETHPAAPAEDEVPEQSSDPAAGPEVKPDAPVLKEHPSEDPAFKGPAGIEG